MYSYLTISVRLLFLANEEYKAIDGFAWWSEMSKMS